MRIILTACALLALATLQARAGCELAIGPCSTDSRGNAYRTEQNLGGGYTTYRNGSPYSTTDQTLGGSYRERFNDGSTRTYNYDPYASSRGRSDSLYPND